MEHFGREQAYAAVMLLGVVPGKEALAKATCILDRAEARPRRTAARRARRPAVARGGAVTAVRHRKAASVDAHSACSLLRQVKSGVLDVLSAIRKLARLLGTDYSRSVA